MKWIFSEFTVHEPTVPLAEDITMDDEGPPINHLLTPDDMMMKGLALREVGSGTNYWPLRKMPNVLLAAVRFNNEE